MKVYISIGSNLGDRIFFINEALRMLGGSVKKVSQIIETDPVEMDENAGKFLNAVAELGTHLQPEELLDVLEGIEKKLGRTDKGKCKSRTIDLDILTYEDLSIKTDRLTIPHVKFKDREFLCKLYKTLKN